MAIEVDLLKKTVNVNLRRSPESGEPYQEEGALAEQCQRKIVTPHALYNAKPKAMLRLALGGIPHHVRICIHSDFYSAENPKIREL